MSRSRLAGQLFLLALLVTAACALTALVLVRQTFERQLRGELGRMVAGTGLALEDAGRELAASMNEIEEHMKEREPRLLELLLRGGPESADAAALIMPLAGLDALEIIDGEGRVISSGSWPERIGLPADKALFALPPDDPALGTLPELRNRRLGLLMRHEIRVGNRRLLLVGGRVLDARFFERLAGQEAALLVQGAGEATVLSTRASRLNIRDIRRRLDSAAGDVWHIADAGGSRWDARTYPLPGVEATIVLAVDRGRLDRLLKRMRNAFILLGAAVSLLAALAGFWIARNISRPVNDLVHAFDAMAAGEADYSYPVSREHELQELIGSVSRLHRALDLQRRRSVAAERVAAWSDVARLVAHEVKNPLAPIRLTVENLLRARRDAPERFDDMFRDGMATIMEEVEQLRRLVAEFSEFARLPQPERQSAELERLLDGAVELYGADAGIRIERRYTGGMPRIDLDTGQISMALKNVLGNAVEASKEMAGTREGPMEIVVSTALEEEMARIEIADRGPGFSEESGRRLYEPYFTTKSEGTGLGMALTNRIIIEHGGLITAENRTGGGARVSIFLPLRAAEVDLHELRTDRR
jgi:two-component system nitrogen regulation sensor histidine kinase NtrY